MGSSEETFAPIGTCLKFFRQSECSFDQRYSSHHRSVMETIPERPPPTSGSRTERLRSADDLRSKEQRRRERRERRAARRQQSYGNPPFTIYGSMQEYRLRLLLFDRQSGSHSAGTGTGGS